MTDTATEAPATSAPVPPTAMPDNIAALSPSQAAAKLDALLAQQEFSAKYLNGDGASRKLVDDLVERKAQTETAEAIVSTADLPLPAAGGVNTGGLSARDVRTGVAALLDDGLSAGAVVELLRNAPLGTAEDYKIIEREFSTKCLRNQEWVKRLLDGDPDAQRQLLAMGVIKVTSRPLPEAPTSGIVK
jgi:hypothetical protein